MRWWNERENDGPHHHGTHVRAEDHSEGKWIRDPQSGVSNRQSSRPEKDKHVHASFEKAGGETNGDDSRIYIMLAFPETVHILKMWRTKKNADEIDRFASLVFATGIISIVLILLM